MSQNVDWATFPISAATLRGSSDTTISSSGGYNAITYTNFSDILTTNPDTFEKGINGIKVKKTGYYVVSAYINCDLSNNATQIKVVGASTLANGVADMGSVSGMSGISYSPSLAYIEAGNTIQIQLAFSASGNITSRGNRSWLTLIQIA